MVVRNEKVARIMEFHGISFDRNVLTAFCHSNGIRRLSLFGSILRDDFGPDSDIDVLVEFEEGRRVSFFDIFDMEENLACIYGRKVDIRTPADLSRYFRKDVLDRFVVQYTS
jgi:hypothetical protein